VASIVAARQHASVGLKLDCPTSFRAWLIRPGKPPERVYRRQEVRFPFIEIRINARNWLPPKTYSEKDLAEMCRYAEEPRLAPMPPCNMLEANGEEGANRPALLIREWPATTASRFSGKFAPNL
jgi:hypothetical protein